TSAARSSVLRRLLSRIRDTQQISRGKLDCLPHATAGFTTSALDGYGLRGHWPTRPAPYASDPVLVHRLVRLLHASFRPSVAGAPLRFAMTSPPSGCQGDFHPRAIEHARHTNENPASLDLAGSRRNSSQSTLGRTLFGRHHEAGDKRAAFVRAAPGFAQALAAISVRKRVCGHRVLHFAERPVPHLFVVADGIIFVDRTGLDFGHF